MAFATFNSHVFLGQNVNQADSLSVSGTQRNSTHHSRFARLLAGSSATLILLGLFFQYLPLGAENPEPSAQIWQAFEQAKKNHQGNPQNVDAAWRFGRAAFDAANLATNNSERAEIAQQGIAVCKQAVTNNANSAPAHYYLGLNEGQLARTRSLSALKLVDLMEVEFTRAIELDASFDYAGPERSLGLLYRDAPVLASIGSRTKARAHLQRALELAPRYPENRLNMIESELKWGDRKQARKELKLLDEAWHDAQGEFSGPAWAQSWADWTDRLDKIKKTLEEPARLESPRH
jgi:tetratricopeptide (TPR) repeat protein